MRQFEQLRTQVGGQVDKTGESVKAQLQMETDEQIGSVKSEILAI